MQGMKVLGVATVLAIPGLAGAVFLGCGAGRAPNGGITRTYYLAAEEVDWDYAPGGIDRITGQPPKELAAMAMTPGPISLGHIFRKAVFREYTDSTFQTPAQRPPEWEHLGMLGPLLRAVVGDTIRVVFRNRATHPHTLHPHGVFYTKESEGAPYEDGSGPGDRADDAVPPGGTHVYVWPVPERAGPTPHEGSSAFWMYHSHHNEVRDVNAGLIGPMIVTARGKARSDGTPNDVDREFVILFGEFDENTSWYFEDNIRANAPDPRRFPRQSTFADPPYLLNLRETMNGLSFGHLTGLTMRRGERVRWYIFANSNFEIHAPHWHGQTVVAHNMRTDVLSLMTMQMVVADMVPDNPGTWLFHCHVAPHLDLGMQALFTVE